MPIIIIYTIYANDNTPHIGANNINDVIHCFEKATDTLFTWFSDNLLKSNADKCYLLVITNNTVNFKIGNIDITKRTCEKFVGANFDHKLTFDDHISELCKKVSTKIHALARVEPYMNLSKKSQFSYCRLVWMCHNCANKSKMKWTIRALLKNNIF